MIFDLDGTPADIGFPDPGLAETDPNGLLAVGGDLSRQRILNAYRRGIFPWYSNGQPLLWWSPAPRMVLYPAEFHVSRSLRRSLRRRDFEVSVNQAFERVVRGCAAARRAQAGTWLVPAMIEAYTDLHHAGFAHSIEVWRAQDLVGGLYGIALGQIFFGESMFSQQTDASKIAMSRLVELAGEQPFELVDCQVHTDHLASLGAREISRERFQATLDRATRAGIAGIGRQPRRPARSLQAAA